MKTATRRETLRAWLDRRGLTIEQFVAAVPGLHYGTVAKWCSDKYHPKAVRDVTRIVVRQKFPDCPLAR